MNSLAIAFVLLYRKVMYPVYWVLNLNNICKQEPSCSHYAEEAFRTHGFLKTCVMTAARLKRCGYVDPHDPVPPAPYSLSQEEKREGAKSLLLMAGAAALAGWVVRRIRIR